MSSVYVFLVRAGEFLHFSDNENLNSNLKLCKFYYLVELLHNRLRDAYVSVENLSLDKSLLLYKGRLGRFIS